MLKFDNDRTADDEADDVTELFTRSPGGNAGAGKLMEWPGKRQIALDVMKTKKNIDAMGVNSVVVGVSSMTEKQRRERSLLWLDFEQKKEIYHEVVGYKFHLFPSMDVKKPEKRALEELYKTLHGYSWSKNKGWIGRPKRLLGPEIRVLEAEASQFEGLICGYHRKPPKPGFNEDGTVIKITTAGSVVGGGEDDQSVASTISGNTLRAAYVKNLAEPIAAKLLGFDLSAVGCVGPMPSCIGDFRDCQSLMLGWNSLYGPIPSELAKLTQLTVLDLSCNKLNGRLDETIFAGLIQLQYLNLSCNQLSGNIPSEMFADWLQLIELNLSQNKFTGPLPNSLSRLTTLEVLRLHSNEFVGSLIPSLCDLNALRSVNLSRNKLNHGSYVLYSCVQLVELQLNDNLFHDYLPSTIGDLQELQLLYLQNNLFHGTVPDAITSLCKLRHMNLSNTKLNGPLPSDIGLLLNLETLLVADTYVTGPIPASISELTKLRDFIVNKPFPSLDMHNKRGFTREKFERLHVMLPSLGVDSLVWDEEMMHGKIPKPPEFDPTNPLNFNSFRNSWQSMLDAGYGL